MTKPVCVPCRRFYKPEKNGFIVLEGMPKFNGAAPAVDEFWEPYKYYRADKWKCPACGHEIVVGFGMAIVQHEPAFKRMMAYAPPDLLVNDC